MHLDGQIVIDHRKRNVGLAMRCNRNTKQQRSRSTRAERLHIIRVIATLRAHKSYSLDCIQRSFTLTLCLTSPQGQAQPLPHADAPWPWPMPLFALGIIYQATSMVIRLVMPNGTVLGAAGRRGQGHTLCIHGGVGSAHCAAAARPRASAGYRLAFLNVFLSSSRFPPIKYASCRFVD